MQMHNFLTYDECEIFPVPFLQLFKICFFPCAINAFISIIKGPKLNVVIGPNGSGKSTITHAICLACCGSTGDIGKTAFC